MTVIDHDGLTVQLDDVGEGLPIVFLHGSFSTAAAWRDVGERLRGRARVIAPNLLGYGGTDDWPADAEPSIQRQVALVEAVFDHVAERVHLVGHSYGASVAVATALARAAKLASLTLIEPLPAGILKQTGETEAYTNLRTMFLAYVEAFENGDRFACRRVIDYWGGEGSFDRFPEKLKEYCADTTRLNIRDWRDGWGFKPSLADYRALDVPTLIVCGEETHWVASTIARGLAALIPNSRLAEIGGASHFVISTHPDEIATLIADHALQIATRPMSS